MLKGTLSSLSQISRATAAQALPSAVAALELGSAAKLAHCAGTDPTGASDF